MFLLLNNVIEYMYIPILSVCIILYRIILYYAALYQVISLYCIVLCYVIYNMAYTYDI